MYMHESGLPRCPDDHFTFAICVCIAIAVDINVILTFRIGRMQQVHRIAHLCMRLGALLGFFLARRDMRNAHECPLVAETLDRLRPPQKKVCRKYEHEISSKE